MDHADRQRLRVLSDGGSFLILSLGHLFEVDLALQQMDDRVILKLIKLGLLLDGLNGPLLAEAFRPFPIVR